MIYIASDHRGFQLKEELKKYLTDTGNEFQDLGPFEFNKDDDYADFAKEVGQRVSANPETDKGILICGSGHGMDMVANKYKGVRSALAFNERVAIQSREHENANILTLPSDWIKLPVARSIVSFWLKTSFTGEERHLRRLKKIQDLEG